MQLYSQFFINPNIFEVLFDKFCSIWIFLETFHSILGQTNIFGFFWPISCIVLPYTDHSGPILTLWNKFVFGLFLVRTHLFEDQYSHKIACTIFVFVSFPPSDYIRIFVWSDLSHHISYILPISRFQKANRSNKKTGEAL